MDDISRPWTGSAPDKRGWPVRGRALTSVVSAEPGSPLHHASHGPPPHKWGEDPWRAGGCRVLYQRRSGMDPRLKPRMTMESDFEEIRDVIECQYRCRTKAQACVCRCAPHSPPRHATSRPRYPFRNVSSSGAGKSGFLSCEAAG